MKESTVSQQNIHPVDRYVGSRLRELRRIKGMSQQNLASILGITFQQVQKYEKGINRLSCSKLYEVAKELKEPIHGFFEGYEEGINHSSSLPKSKDALLLLRLYNRLGDDRLKKAFLHLLKSAIPQDKM